MFSGLTKKFQDLLSSLARNKKISEDNIIEAVKEVRLALLEADVNYTVVSNFIRRVKEKALGDSVIKSVTPDEQFVKIVHDELVALMGAKEEPLNLKGYPTVILLCGLQGSGKTTFSVKLARFLKKKEYKKRVLLAACDLQRPAAIDQLKKLGDHAEIPVFSIDGAQDPLYVAQLAYAKAQADAFDVLIVDTAGRLHLDEALMEELQKLKLILKPQEILFVANAATGQDAVKVAAEFDAKLGITGTVLTMLDGSARAGAALSIREVTQKPLKFEGIGEKIDDLQVFNPKSMADRILGMGDVINLVRRAQEHVDEEESRELEKKLRKAAFTYQDYLRQMSVIKKMGSFKGILKMLPGLSNLGEVELSDDEFSRLEAMILSMTPEERQEKVELMPSRRRRIATGSGVSVDEVNRMVKGFKKLKLFMKEMPALKQKMNKTGKMENFLWH